ncbi:hypothetical protein [Prauserella cavernicola]|uniref:HTH marR-type domain-containing protein n=1 Tax=Prauserella cavernicola TaxID=2800127 RepID=A0A934V7Z3_9PSEU|nr:hypothetical protein [Prauserella cavernicola]MBK1789117.1 hypothetical protein [Prauserella cavernicola]
MRRDPHPEDRRTRLVVLTERGRDTLASAQRLAREVDDALLGELDDAERRTLEGLLARLG